MQFLKAGFSSHVFLNEEICLEHLSECDVAVFNTDSRALSANEAYAKLTALTKELQILENFIIYKKIDSTMRGNVGTEIDAVLEATDIDFCIVAPAYPENRRITVGGYHLLGDSLLEDTEFAQDPKCPITDSFLPGLLQKQSKYQVGFVDLEVLRRGNIREVVTQMVQEGKRIIVFDGVKDADLKAITKTYFQTDEKILWVGSAGLAHSLANQMVKKEEFLENYQQHSGMNEKAILVVAGSLSSHTREQIAFLKRQGTRVISIHPVQLLQINQHALNHYLEEAKKLLQSGQHVVLTTEHTEETTIGIRQYVRENNMSNLDLGNRIAKNLGMLAAQLLNHVEVNGVILTGGDIAYQTCKALGIESLEIIDEVEEGIPLCKVSEGFGKDLLIITKAGAFGSQFSLFNAVNKIQQQVN